MPKNTKGGKKAKSMKNSSTPIKSREIPIPEDEDDSHIAIITKVYGDSRYLCQIVNNDGTLETTYPVHISKGVKNKYARNIIVNIGTYILMSIRDFEKDKGDIIFVYKDSELPYLVENNYIKMKTEEGTGDIVFLNEEIDISNI